MKFKDRLKLIIYHVLRPTSYTSFNCCSKCKKRRRNYWQDTFFKPDYLVGYDRMLGEWKLFQDVNVIAKIWFANDYITDVHPLNKKMWETIYPLCNRCIKKFFVTYKEDITKK